MSNSRLEQCMHLDCGFENRLEYCAIEADDPAGSAPVVAELIDYLLCEPSDIEGSGLRVHVDDDVRTIQRVFSSLDGNQDSYLLTETTTLLQYHHDRALSRDRYMIAISWIVEQAADIKPVTSYYVDIYSAGPVQAMIVEPDGETRRMTEYDYTSLFEHVEQMATQHIA